MGHDTDAADTAADTAAVAAGSGTSAPVGFASSCSRYDTALVGCQPPGLLNQHQLEKQHLQAWQQLVHHLPAVSNQLLQVLLHSRIVVHSFMCLLLVLVLLFLLLQLQQSGLKVHIKLQCSIQLLLPLQHPLLLVLQLAAAAGISASAGAGITLLPAEVLLQLWQVLLGRCTTPIQVSGVTPCMKSTDTGTVTVKHCESRAADHMHQMPQHASAGYHCHANVRQTPVSAAAATRIHRLQRAVLPNNITQEQSVCKVQL